MGRAQTVQAIPNKDFENWDSTSYEVPDSPWICSNPASIANIGIANVTKVAGFSGQAVHIETDIVKGDTLVGQISNTGDHAFGVPYTQMPTAIKGYFRCNMIGHDTGFLFVGFIKGGNIYYEVNIPFYGNVSSFTAFNDTINPPVAPDSMIIEAVSSNLVNFVDINAGSWIELDELAFTGTGITQQIANGNFDSWHTHTDFIPDGWHAPPSYNEGDTTGISRSTDHYSGQYSLKLREPHNTFTQLLSTGKFDQYANVSGGQPYRQTNDTLTGYYKYIPNGPDTAGLEITLQNQGNVVLQLGEILTSTPVWTYFEVPLGNSAIPDTIRIDLYASINYSGKAGSELFIDDLQLKFQRHTSGILPGSKPSMGISAFPNPTQNQLNIRFNGNVPSEFGLKIFNSEGRLLIDNEFNPGSSTIAVPIDQLSSGLYFYEINANGSLVRNKFVKGN
jgi:hypothetical protein